MQIVGSVSKDGKKSNGDLAYYNSHREAIDTIHLNGRYKITFLIELPQTPVVVASGDGGRRGCSITVVNITPQSFIVESRSYDTNGLEDSGFNFIAVV